MVNKFIILIGSYNNAKWVEDNLNSVLSQDYPNYKVIYFDDASTDGTDKLVAKKINGNSKFSLYSSIKRQYKSWFFSEIENTFPLDDNDILVFLDGDDMFYCENILSYLNEIYNQTNCWMTYGGMIVWSGGTNISEPFPQNSEIPKSIIAKKAFRQDTWRTSHLKTMRAFVWKQIDKQDLIHDGKPIVGPDDLAIMFAALELTPPEKIHRVTEPIYLYNHTPENQNSRAFTDNKTIGIDYEQRIRSRKPYNTIPVICPTIAGGLGNQMFEVAAAASLAKDNNAVVIINPNEHILPNQGRNINNYTDNVFSRIMMDTTISPQNQITIEECFYKPITFSPNSKLRGHFQSYKYFHHNQKYIQSLFAPTRFILDKINTIYPTVSKITAIQVRRGDYFKFPDHHPLLPVEYYVKAVKLANPAEVWVFSDSIEWCKEKLSFDCPVRYVKDEDYIELYLMSFCKNVIISNSSFGWWAAYLNKQNGKIYVPNVWFGPALIKDGFQYDDLIPNNWITIN